MKEPTDHAIPSGQLVMTMAHYIRLGDQRRAFDDWLQNEDLVKESVCQLRFGEGQVVALVYPEPKRVVEVDGEREVYSEERVFPVKSLPPDSVLERLRAIDRDMP